MELITHKDGDIVSISNISEVIVSNCSSLMLMKECDILRGSKHTLTLPTYFRGSEPPRPRIYTPGEPLAYSESIAMLFASICMTIVYAWSVELGD